MARYQFWISLGAALMHQSPIFDSGLIISLSHPTLVGLVWREVGVLSLDQWVLGNSQVSIFDQFRCGISEIQKGAHLNRDISQFPHGVSLE